MRRAHFPLVHRRTRAAFSRSSVAVAAILARELAISLVFGVLALELLEARKRFGLALGLLGIFPIKGIVPGKTAVRISVSGLRGICASVEGPPVGGGASGIIRAGTNVAGAVVRVATVAADVAERARAGIATGTVERALADFASVVFGIAQAFRRAGGIVGVSARAGSRI